MRLELTFKVNLICGIYLAIQSCYAVPLSMAMCHHLLQLNMKSLS